MKRRRRRASKLLLGTLLAAAIIGPIAAAANGQIALTPARAYPAARGGAQYQAQPGQRELQVEVEHIRSLAGRPVLIFVNGAKVGVARVTRRGVAELHRNTERGQGVPRIRAGGTVRVRTTHGALIVTGSF